MKVSEFDFELPTELIAQHPLERRDASRMLVVNAPTMNGLSSPPVEGCPEPRVPRPSVSAGRGREEGAGWSFTNKSTAYFNIPYNQNLKDRAKELRKSRSLPEALFWKEIKNKKLLGLDFDRQKVIGNYIVDFFCPSTLTIIEIDDKATHDYKYEYDEKRNEFLKSLGLKIIHIPASNVLKNPHNVFEYLEEELKTTPALRATPPQEGNLDHPAAARHPSTGGELNLSYNFEDKHISDFISYLRPGDVVVFNNSKVIPARFDCVADDGTKYEITLHTKVSSPPSPRLRGALDFATATSRGQNRWWGLSKKFQKLRVGETLKLDGYENEYGENKIRIIDKNDDSGLLIEFPFTDEELFRVLEQIGKMPLPPYMKRDQETADRDRYQTVYADPVGSMAAPTAGLHFTPELLNAIRVAGAEIVNITLHVGAGTWMPIKTEDTENHHMHSEWGVITEAQANIINNAQRVIAIGTTSLRLLESAAGPYGIHPFCDTTDIFITPGYKFKVVDVLLTNFHLPKSTLFMLVSAFAGLPEMRAAYAHAVAEKYRFFSYGDCCLLFKKS